MIPSENSHLEITGGTHDGMRGKNNEDRFAISHFFVSEVDATPVSFSIIADGIGGHNAGEVAAEIAVSLIGEFVKECDGSEPLTSMSEAIELAGNEIYAQAEKNEDQQGMGTTVICAWIIQSQLYIASVGNSRIYLLRNNKMIQLNKDHSWVQEAIDLGVLGKDEARTHPYSSVIRRYLGSPETVDVDLRLWLDPGESDKKAEKNQGMRLNQGDRLLLCSDGLNDMVYDDKIQEIISSNSGDHAIQELIEEANSNGGKDNITCILIDI